jgi:hypothetical protein
VVDSKLMVVSPPTIAKSISSGDRRSQRSGAAVGVAGDEDRRRQQLPGFQHLGNGRPDACPPMAADRGDGGRDNLPGRSIQFLHWRYDLVSG